MLQRLKERTTATDVIMWLIGAALVALTVWGSTATLIKGTYTARQWTDFVIFGLAQGSIYALIAMGYTMVYGVLRMINFAHSEVFMSGPYTAYFFAAYSQQNGMLDEYPVAEPGRDLHRFDGDLDLDRRAARAHRVPAAARRPAPRPAHHRHRRLLLPAVHVPGVLRLGLPGLPGDQAARGPARARADPHSEVPVAGHRRPRPS